MAKKKIKKAKVSAKKKLWAELEKIRKIPTASAGTSIFGKP
jgi:hypothetical protein